MSDVCTVNHPDFVSFGAEVRERARERVSEISHLEASLYFVMRQVYGLRKMQAWFTEESIGAIRHDDERLEVDSPVSSTSFFIL